MFTIDKYSRVPIYEQIIEQVEMHIALGDLAPESLLPSVRSLSVELSVNPNTLQKAYAELERRGLCYSVPGNGCFISPGRAGSAARQPAGAAPGRRGKDRPARAGGDSAFRHRLHRNARLQRSETSLQIKSQ